MKSVRAWMTTTTNSTELTDGALRQCKCNTDAAERIVMYVLVSFRTSRRLQPQSCICQQRQQHLLAARQRRQRKSICTHVQYMWRCKYRKVLPSRLQQGWV